ncbi:MAG: NAD-dependent epimerase/dehydratase family protein [Deltaproteobacteria bacterium]|uniref:NAD-dependent epimerase/dehydratase family protein n=1 Tax=Candidatus Zymogenus saltonus TaxID=2844893 RepID=A0A9D8PRD4_9DELT|nr:NAD-dependent epimerase/dehydratase family protein [Candidatus Zymogenus saltonus]
MARSLIPRLLSLGFSVRGFDTEAVENPIEDVEYLTGDINKSSIMSEMTHGVDHIFHLPGRHPEDEGSSGKNREGKGFTTTIKLANIAKSLDVVSFVYLSSSEVYGIPRKILISEKEKRRPISRRGKELLRIEDYLINTMASRGIGVVIVRTPPITGWGAPKESFPSLVHGARRALTGRAIFLVGGGKYPVQYVDVEDLASALVRSIRKVKPGCLELNVAAEDVITQRDLADFFIDFYHSSSGTISLPAAAVPFLCLMRGLGAPLFATESNFLFYPQTIIDTFRAKELLLYSPKRTVESISEMLKSWDIEGTERGPRHMGKGYGGLFRD